MSTIKIRNLPLATNEQVKPGNFLACALDTNSGLQKLTRKLTLSQVVSGGLQDGIVPIPITSLPIATTTSLGVVEIGANLNITPEGILSADNPTAPYQLPTASATVLGGIKVGNNLTIDPDGTLNAPAPSGGGGGAEGDVYRSAERTLTASSNITVSHGLGSMPDLATGYLICKTAEGGYSIGDRIEVLSIDTQSPAEKGVLLRKSTTQVIASIGQGIEVPNQSSLNSSFNITLGNWKLVIEAVKFGASGGGSLTAPAGTTVATSGTSTLPGGLIIKFGQGTSTSDSQETFTFPTAFPNNHFSTVLNRTDANASLMINPDSISTSGFTINRDDNISGSKAFNFISIGN